MNNACPGNLQAWLDKEDYGDEKWLVIWPIRVNERQVFINT